MCLKRVSTSILVFEHSYHPPKKNKKNEKNKEKVENRALARPHPPGGAAARSENAILLATRATAPPRPSYGARTHCTRSRDGPGSPACELGHIRPKLPSSMASLRPPLSALSWNAHPRDGLGASARMTHKRKSMAAKGKGKLATPPTRKSPRLAGLPPSLPPTSPKFVLRPNKLLVLTIAADAIRIHSKAWESPQAPVVEPPKDVKGKRTARITVKPLRKRFP
ncbi:hypothetical protein PIB30_087309 [Stylosanthes scabra]|uniref:Uncharacterized protein n=1 Tax=Stylosanthes scabra TaxID=79078 RepID=A0ABU6YSX4_9FABA|nr:hypothetical protein [Stylosanthes scabra]